MKYKLIWVEFHNPENWHDENKNNGIENILNSLPNPKLLGQADDGWVEVEAHEHLEADSIEELKNLIKNYDFINQVFSVVDENNKTVLTEEDF